VAAGSPIRELTRGDARELAALYAANRNFLAPFEPERGDAWFTAPGQRDRLSRPIAGWRFAIVDDGRIAGSITISDVVRGAFESAHLGYWVAQDRNGRGLATAAVAAAVEFAFGPAKLHRLQAGTLVDNHGSQRVLEKNGFERIGLARLYLHIGGAWRDHVLFQRTAD
jgi:[ribosomal protein S5]-alanine N-acetyltransferase